MVKNLLIKGNSKMGKQVYLFNLPPIKTCTPTEWCLGANNNNKPNCYALKNQFLFPNVKKGMQERYEASLKDDFVDRMVFEFSKAKPKYFRFHSSGDFYSEEYVNKIIDIASTFPDTLFRTTTRRRDLTSVIFELNKLPNFIVRESLDSERPIPVMGLPFAALDSLDVVQNEKSYACPNDCPTCDYYCWIDSTNMHFKEH